MPLLWGLARAGACLAGAIGLAATVFVGGGAHASTLDVKRDARIHLTRNAPRGLEFVPTSTPDGEAGKATAIKVTPSIKIELDGDPIDNVYSNLLPLDINGNGTSEYLHW